MTSATKSHLVSAAIGLAMSVVGFAAQSVVHGEAVEAVVAEKLATHSERIGSHDTRLGDLEAVVKILAEAQARTSATQEAIARMVERMDARHDEDVRELRGKRR